MIRRLLPLAVSLTAVALIVGTWTNPALAWYPNAVQVELGTTTWCANCPDSYDAIEYNKGIFGTYEFSAIRYYDSNSGGELSTPETDARNAYYGITTFPTAVFNGLNTILGGGEEIATGEPYQETVAHLLSDPSYFKMTVNSFSATAGGGSIDLDIEVMEPVPSISNMVVRMALLEDGVFYPPHTHEDVTRDMLDEIAITVDDLGEVQNVQQNFTVDGTWVPENLELVAFIQDDADMKVHTSVGTAPIPDYAMRYYALGERIAAVDFSVYENFESGWLRVYNAGLMTDTFTVEVTQDGPDDWFSNLCDEYVCYGPIFSAELPPGAYYELYVDVFPFSSGSAEITATISQTNGAAGHERMVKYCVLTDDLEVLLVDDDGSQDHEQCYTGALDTDGILYGVVDRRISPISATIMDHYPVVVWCTGEKAPTLDADDRDALGTYLDHGGALLASGQDIAHDLGDPTFGTDPDWLHTYLHAGFVLDDSYDTTLDGVENDPVSYGMSLTIEGGDCANNQDSPDVISAWDGSATEIWKYNATRVGAIRADNGTHRVVYLAFGFEGIDNAADRLAVMRQARAWLLHGAGVDEHVPGFRLALGIAPNPTRENAAVRFTLPSAGGARLEVYGPEGRLVRTLVDGDLGAGNHVVSWDRADARGARVPAGVYYYRLETANETLVRKAVMLK